MRTAKVADSVADDLITQAKYTKQDIKNEQGTRTFDIWKEYDPIAEKKAIADKKAAEKAALKEEIMAEIGNSSNGTQSLEDLRVEYEQVVGKKPHHMFKEERLKEEIKKAKQ